jgi:integrase
MPLHMLKDQLAHSDIQTTEIYLGMRSQMRTMIQERMDMPPGPLPPPTTRR